MTDEAVIFLHIPKCAGRTLAGILERAVPPERRWEVDPDAIAASRAALAGLSERERAGIDLLYGHLCYGWHELLPRRAVYITIVRDPVARVVSHYDYVRSRPGSPHYLRDAVVGQGMSLRDYVESGVCDEVNNGQVRLLAGVEDIVQEPYGASVVPYGTNDPALLEQALGSIDEHFAVVGLRERFEATLLLLRTRLGIRAGAWRSRNVGRSRYPRTRPTAADVAAVERYNRLDMELYQTMRERFERDLSLVPLAPARTRLIGLAGRLRGRVRPAAGAARDRLRPALDAARGLVGSGS